MKFSKVIIFGYYDGTTDGLIYDYNEKLWYYFYLIDWDDYQEKRIFAFELINKEIFRKLLSYLKTIDQIKWPFWYPNLKDKTVEEIQTINNEIDNRLNLSKKLDYIVAWENSEKNIIKIKNVSSLDMNNIKSLIDTKFIPEKDWFQFMEIKR